MERRLAEFVQSCRGRPRVVEYNLKNWIIQSKEKITGATIRGYIAAAKSLLDFCGVILNWKQIYSVVPDVSHAADDEATPIDATRKLFKIADNRIKFLISLFLSSGIRLGAVSALKVKEDSIC
ncbi:MAG: hypothetical protein JRN15_12410 [Nitrososphaerota archaeon]|nr:hypothetical protein [Nitrososphaerota archaeon]